MYQDMYFCACLYILQYIATYSKNVFILPNRKKAKRKYKAIVVKVAPNPKLESFLSKTVQY